MSILTIQTPRVFKPLLAPARYKGAKGGRGSGKSHFFAEALIECCIANRGFRAVCIREILKSLKQSAKILLEDKIEALGVSSLFRVLTDSIVTPGGGVILFQGMQDHTAESIKSLEGMDVAWTEEAQTLSKKSLELLRPTIRKEKSELWFSWNPRDASDAVDDFFALGNRPDDAVLVTANWSDNPFFPDVLEKERLHDKKHKPDRYDHIWEGGYEPSVVGAIWDYKTINTHRRDKAPDMGTILVSIDHAISTGDHANEHGIIVGGKGVDGRGYTLADLSMGGQPQEWANRVISAYDLYNADGIVVETNQGGDLVKSTLDAIRPGLPIREVRASRGKHVRAAPIAALSNTGKISHVGSFPELEAQMCKMTADGWQGPKDQSPDRVDAYVWLYTELFPELITKSDNWGGQLNYSDNGVAA